MGNTRRRLLGSMGLVLVAPALAWAQQPGRVYRIGFLGIATPTPELLKQSLVPFREAMRGHGWIEGQHYVIEQRWAEGKFERHPELARELVGLGADVLMAVTNAGIRALMQATQTLPIVMIAPSDPVGDGLVASYARPGGNVTGLAFDIEASNYLKQVDHLRQIVPKLASIAVFANPDGNYLSAKTLSAAIGSRGLKVLAAGARTPEEIEPEFARMKAGGAQAVIVVADGLVANNAPRIAQLAVKHRLPLASQWLGVPRAGGLMAYSPELADFYRRAAGYVVKILRGARPTDLPVEQASSFKLVINLKTAKALGLAIPQAVLVLADEVIE
jgi:putative ABC transport system substrate-binding protein